MTKEWLDAAMEVVIRGAALGIITVVVLGAVLTVAGHTARRVRKAWNGEDDPKVVDLFLNGKRISSVPADTSAGTMASGHLPAMEYDGKVRWPEDKRRGKAWGGGPEPVGPDPGHQVREGGMGPQPGGEPEVRKIQGLWTVQTVDGVAAGIHMFVDAGHGTCSYCGKTEDYTLHGVDLGHGVIGFE